MTTFESDIRAVKTSPEIAFAAFSDLRNIEGHLNKMPDDQVKISRVEHDVVFFNIEMAGEVGLKLIDKTPFSTIKFETVNSPVNFNLWIQLKEAAPNDTRVKLTLKSDMNSMVKVMIAKPVKRFLDKLADAIAVYDFE